MGRNRRKAFTLAELLIALAILGVIATFTIPKVLQAQKYERFNAIAKETAGSLSDAYMRLRSTTGFTASTGVQDLTPYLNYVSVDTVSTLDWGVATTWNCSLNHCLKLHNGATLIYHGANAHHFGGTASTNAMEFMVDPDSTYNLNGMSFYLYTDGKIRDEGNTVNNTYTSDGGPYLPCPGCMPSWFHWN